MNNKELWGKLTELLGGDETARRFRVWANKLIKKELIKRSEMNADEFFLEQASAILADLNKRTGRNYELTAEAKKMIRVVMGAGYCVEDFQKVHEVMVKKWVDDPNMKDYLRPSTLWQLKKFSERLALWEPPKSRGVERSRSQEVESKRQDDASTAKLMAKKWWEFESWAEFMKWTVQFPNAESLAKYEMPARIRVMRTAPKMVWLVLKGESPQWAEDEYREMKKDFEPQRKAEKSRG